jgi:hypothetical protein
VTKDKSIRVFPWLMAGLVALFVVGVAGLLLADTGNNPEIGGRTVKAWLAILQNGNYEERKEATRQLVLNREESLPSLVRFLESNPNPVHVAAVKFWNRFSSHQINVPD